MERILVARGDAIGDTLLSLPAIHALHARWPDARLTVVSSPAAAQVFAADPAVAQVIAPRSMSSGDLAFSFTEKMWGYEALQGSDMRVGFWPGWSKPLKSLQLWPRLTHRVASVEDQTRDQGIHEVERYFRLLQAVGVDAAPGPIRMAVSAEDRAWGNDWVASRGLDGFLGLHLSDKWLRQGWPMEFLQTLVRRLDAVVLYGPSEAAWAAQIEAGESFFDPSLGRYAAVLAHARLLVTMDTSAVHVAASEGVPVIDIFPTLHFAHNSNRWRPWRVGHALVEQPAWSVAQEVTFSAAIAEAVEQVQRSYADQCRRPHL